MSFKEGDVVQVTHDYKKGEEGLVTGHIGPHYYVRLNIDGEIYEYYDTELMLVEREPSVGLRYNAGKLPYHLLPDDAIQEVVRVLQKGAEKYAERNWQNGLKWDSECASSLQRHLAAWKLGEDNDSESGLPHMAHVATNALFLLHFAINGTGEDDRYAYKQS